MSQPSPRQQSRPALPELGAWDGPIYGQLGVLATDGQRVECHMCGRWYKLLPSHVWRAHGATADEYRALFGLSARHGLVSPDLSARLREHALQVLRPWYEHAADLARTLTPEQRSEYGRGRRLRLETRLDPRWQASRQATGPQTSVRMRAWWDGLDADARAAVLARFRRERTPATCVVCGARFFSDSHGPRAKTCSPACARTHRQELGRTLQITTRPEVRSQIATAARARRNTYEQEMAALGGIDAGALNALPRMERQIVRLYYGLDAGNRPHSMRELMTLTGLTRGEIERKLQSGLLRLLDPAVLGLSAACVVCGAMFVRGLNPNRATCGPDCQRDLRLANLRANGGLQELIAKARQRGRPALGKLRGLLEQNATALEVLSERERLVLCLYHGLPAEGLRVDRPWTRREIAAQLGQGATVWEVKEALRVGLQRLFQPEAVLSRQQRRAIRRQHISEKARNRGRPASALLRELPAGTFERLPEPQRSALRRYYGLDGGQPWSRREIAAACGRSTEWVARTVSDGTAQLLGEQSLQSVAKSCVICASRFSSTGYRSGRKTCSDTCNSELRRRNAVAWRAARSLSQRTRSPLIVY